MILCLILKLLFSLTVTVKIRVRVSVSVRVSDRLGLAFFKDLCDSNAHQNLVYNIGSKFDGGACNYKSC